MTDVTPSTSPTFGETCGEVADMGHWEVEGEPVRRPRAILSRASVAVCSCGYRSVFCHITYSVRVADEMADEAARNHVCAGLVSEVPGQAALDFTAKPEIVDVAATEQVA